MEALPNLGQTSSIVWTNRGTGIGATGPGGSIVWLTSIGSFSGDQKIEPFKENEVQGNSIDDPDGT